MIENLTARNGFYWFLPSKHLVGRNGYIVLHINIGLSWNRMGVRIAFIFFLFFFLQKCLFELWHKATGPLDTLRYI